MTPESSTPSALANPDTAFAFLMENVKDYGIFLMEPSGQIVRWNAGAEHILGYAEAEVLGCLCNIIFTPEDLAKGEPQRERDQAAREGRSVDERWHMRKDGSRFWASGIMTALFNNERELQGYAKILRDFTQQKRTQDALEASHARIDEILESITDAFYAVDAEFRFTYANQKTEELWGWRREELVGKHYWTHFPQAVGSVAYERHLRAMEEQRAQHFEAVSPILHKWVEVHIYPIREGGLSVYFRDISQRKRVEEALLRHQADIEALNRRLSRAITETHHRVKNSLQVVGAMVDMLTLRGEGSVPLTDVQRVGQHIQTMASIQDLLTQQVKGGEQGNEVSGRVVLERLTPLLERTTGGRPLIVNVDEANMPVETAASLCILINELVSNAIKHAEGAIEVSLTAEGEIGILTVFDQGPGFPDGFDPQAAANTGLELIEGITRFDLGGEVTFDNRHEGGCVTVRFPLAS